MEKWSIYKEVPSGSLAGTGLVTFRLHITFAVVVNFMHQLFWGLLAVFLQIKLAIQTRHVVLSAVEWGLVDRAQTGEQFVLIKSVGRPANKSEIPSKNILFLPVDNHFNILGFSKIGVC